MSCCTIPKYNIYLRRTLEQNNRKSTKEGEAVTTAVLAPEVDSGDATGGGLVPSDEASDELSETESLPPTNAVIVSTRF